MDKYKLISVELFSGNVELIKESSEREVLEDEMESIIDKNLEFSSKEFVIEIMKECDVNNDKELMLYLNSMIKRTDFSDVSIEKKETLIKLHGIMIESLRAVKPKYYGTNLVII